MSVSGKRVVVTGGSRGMGEATVLAFAEAGARVVVLDVLDGLGDQVVAEANRRSRDSAHYIRCDISTPASVDAAFQGAMGHLGGLDVLVNAAGVLGRCDAVDISPEEHERVFGVNVLGTVLTNQAAFKAMKAGGGRIINFTSGAALSGYRGGAHYAASKGAVLSWTRSVALEWAPHEITVNAIAPSIWTPMYEERRAGLNEEQLAAHDGANVARIPMGGKLGDPVRDFAPVMIFLASDGSRFITGQLISVTGGATLTR